jgi:hypothetical protein
MAYRSLTVLASYAKAKNEPVALSSSRQAQQFEHQRAWRAPAASRTSGAHLPLFLPCAKLSPTDWRGFHHNYPCRVTKPQQQDGHQRSRPKQDANCDTSSPYLSTGFRVSPIGNRQPTKGKPMGETLYIMGAVAWALGIVLVCEKLLQMLKDAGHYPYSDLDRQPVA